MAVDVSGLNELASAFHEAAGAQMARKCETAMKVTGLGIVTDAKILAPVDTGALMNSIGMVVTGSVASGVMQIDVAPGVDYGYWVEVGTSRTRPQPYMNPAADRRIPGFEDAMGQLGVNIL